MTFNHGASGYTHHGCRCATCSAAKAYLDAKSDAARRAIFAETGILPEGVSHGTSHAYDHYGCRCDDCKAANRSKHARIRANKRLITTGGKS